jgi:hypothetical protein
MDFFLFRTISLTPIVPNLTIFTLFIWYDYIRFYDVIINKFRKISIDSCQNNEFTYNVTKQTFFSCPKKYFLCYYQILMLHFQSKKSQKISSEMLLSPKNVKLLR